MHSGFAEFPCDVRQGGLREAILHSVGANATHGLRRSNADKRRAVLLLLEDEEWSKWADREIARRCFVSQPLVSRIREDHLQIVADAPRTVSRGGNVYTMDTGAIGRKLPAEPEPAALPPGTEPAVSEPPVPDELTDALARQFGHDADQLRATKDAAGGDAPNVFTLRFPPAAAPSTQRRHDGHHMGCGSAIST